MSDQQINQQEMASTSTQNYRSVALTGTGIGGDGRVALT